MFTVIMTVHDRVKESFEPTVLQKLCVGFLTGVYNSTGLPLSFECPLIPREIIGLFYYVNLNK